MKEGNSMADWVKVAQIAKEHGRSVFFGVAVQADVDDGTHFCVVFDANSKTAIKGGLSAIKEQLDKLEELGVLVERD